MEENEKTKAEEKQNTNQTEETKESEMKQQETKQSETKSEQTSQQTEDRTAEGEKEVKVETFNFEDSSPLDDSKKMSQKRTSHESSKSAGSKKKKKSKLNKRKLGVIGIGAVLVVSVAVLVVSNRNKLINISENQIIDDQTYEVNSRAQFYNTGDTMFYATKDGMKIYDVKTKSEITDTFTMGSPLMITDGGYVAVAEEKGKQVRVYNTEGNAYNIVTDGEIISFTVNPNGYTGVCYTNKKDNTYTVDVYNPASVQISHTKSTTDNGIPISIDLSDDGKILAISYLNTTELNLKSNILFYYTNNKDAAAVDNSDGMFSSFIFENEIVGEVHFLTNDDCVAITDKQLVDYKYGTSYTERWKYEFTNYLLSVEYPANSSVICAYGEKMTNVSDEGLKTNTVQWYNANGKTQLEIQADKTVTELYAKQDSVIVGMNRYFEAYSAKGDLMWTYTSTQDVNSMQFYKNTNKVVIVTPTKMTVTTIKKGTNSSDNADEIANNAKKEAEQETVAEQTTQAESVATTAAQQ
jgi:hypothetical protein